MMKRKAMLFVLSALALLLMTGWAQAGAAPQKTPDAVIIQTGGIFELPASLQAIDDEAFAGTAVQTVFLPDGLIRLGDRSFADIRTLRSVFIPASTKVIGRDAFRGSEEMTICAAEGSYARAYAAANGFRFIGQHAAVLSARGVTQPAPSRPRDPTGTAEAAEERAERTQIGAESRRASMQTARPSPKNRMELHNWKLDFP